jgi:lambda family phage portal protein
LNKFFRSLANWFSNKPQKNKRNYEAAKMDRLSNNWFNANANPEETDAPARPLLRARCRDLERNSEIIEAIISAITRNSIGNGLKVQARTELPDGTDNAELNSQIEKLWTDWSRARNCDIQGQLSLPDIQKMIIRRRKVDGGIFIIKNYDKTAKIPFKLQVIEYDNLDTTKAFPLNDSGILCINGIELDSNLKPIAYWFKQETYNVLVSNSIRIEAIRVIHLFKKNRPGQIMGVSEFASVMKPIKDISDYVEAEVVAQRIAACFSLFVSTEDPQGHFAKVIAQMQAEGEEVDDYISSIEPGIITRLKPGEDIKVAQPGRNSQTTKDFMEMELRLISAGVGLSYEAVSRSMKGVNFSSARQSYLEDRRTYQQEQQFMMDYFLYEVYTEFVISAVTNNQLNIPDFWNNKNNYLAHDWIIPGWPWVDPVKEVTAAKEEIKAGLNTLAGVCAAHGKDYQDVLKQRAREQAFAQSLGLNLDIDALDVSQIPLDMLVDKEDDVGEDPVE